MLDNDNPPVPNDPEALCAYLADFVTPARLERMRGVLAQRSRYITAVLEDIFQPHNASAVVRSCDCFGIQDLYVIENHNRYRVNPDVTLGSTQWITLKRRPAAPGNEQTNTLSVIDELRRCGYRIVATSPHHHDQALDDFDATRGPAAFLFGTELTGLSAAALAAADEFVRIPMYGFTESFNISVSAALVLREATRTMRRSAVEWKLPAGERATIMVQWLRHSIKHAAAIEQAFYSQRGTS